MSNLKINTEEALMTKLCSDQFCFESLNGNEKAKNQEIFEQVALYMPVTKLEKKIYYRARVIQEEDGKDTGIFRKKGIPVTGYNISHSGVAPVNCITEKGRVNHVGEQVLYLAEDVETACKENKADKDAYISVAECHVRNYIKVADFSITVSTGLMDTFSQDIVQLFQSRYDIDIRAMYIFIKNYLENPNFKDEEIDYACSLNFLDKVKKKTNLSGIRYTSSFTGKFNIALWDKNKLLECKNSKVVKNL